jgi:hypothetical protein
VGGVVEVGDGDLDIVERDPVVGDAGPRLGHPVGDHHVGGQVTWRATAAEQDPGEEGGIDPAQRSDDERDVRRLFRPSQRLDEVGVDREPAHVGQRKAGQPGVTVRIDAQAIRGGHRRCPKGIVREDDPFGLAR